MLWVVLVVSACGNGSSAGEVAACKRMQTLCGEQFSQAEVHKCATDWPEFRTKFGEDTAKRFEKCTREAKSCPEVLGCAAGVVGRLGKDFETGMDKMSAEEHTEKSTESHTDKSIETRTERHTRMLPDMPPMPAAPDMPAMPKMPPMPDDPFNKGPLPAECSRADEVCAPDEPFARDGCRRTVGNLKADPDNMKELTTCYAAAKNCFAFKKCNDDMWFKLN